MKTNWKTMAASLAVLIGISGVAFGADKDDHHDRDDRARVEHRDHDRNWDRDHDNRRWNDGRVYNNGWYRDHDRDDRRVYNNGYYGGYRNNGYYGNPGYYGNGYYGNRVGYYGGNAAQIGFQDGINDGRSDRMTGHSFRPTQDDNFKNATRGYSSAYGDKQGYKNTYRQGYEQGYQQGYGR